MKKAKKLLALLLTGLMVFAMTACGKRFRQWRQRFRQ